MQSPAVCVGLPRLCSLHQYFGVDEPECVDHDLALHALDGVDYDGHCAVIQLLEALLRVDVDHREPAAEAWVRVVPSDDHFVAAYLLHHVHHVLLVRRVDSLDAHTRTALRHREHVDHLRVE